MATDPIATLRAEHGLAGDVPFPAVGEVYAAIEELERRERLLCAFEADLRAEGLLGPDVRFLDKYEAEQFPCQKKVL